MYLKRIDIVGFKSFADRISIDFVPGVTAVVGPNGSGKSNIIDAVRWVLGEQSAKSLRGTKMEDVIFGGSDKRKPLNVAEVTITLENGDKFLPVDYTELSITRRVYRSGESEFFINKQPCRLKDIVELFMDSGLGKEAFSIISQGKVEEILSSKAEERRSIFEEAAGVLKYKTRKKKAEMKLVETEENLHRVEDILHEIESQLEPLKIQSQIAKDYLEKQKQLEQTEVAVIVHEIEHLHAEWKQILQRLDEVKDQEIKLATKIQSYEVKLEEIKQTMYELDETIEELQEELLETTKEAEKYEGKRRLLEERKKNADNNKQQMEQEAEQLKATIGLKKQQLQNEKQQLEHIINILKQKEIELRELETEQRLLNQNIEQEIEARKSDYFELLNQQAAWRNELKYMEGQLSQQEARKTRLEKENEKYLQARAELRLTKEALEQQLTKKTTFVTELTNVGTRLKKEYEERKEQYEQLQTKLYKAYQFIEQFRSKKEMLEELQDDYAGYFHGVKEVLKAKLTGVYGAVAELVQVDKKFETAIEIALGQAMQHIVVDNETNARGAIQFLKKHNYGRATFLPLSVIKSRAIAEHYLGQIKNHPSYIGIASDLLAYDKKFINIIANLLGSVIIAKDLTGANELAKLVDYRYRIVTIEGDVVNPGGSMTGGTVKQKQSSLLSRQRELEEITERLQLAEEKTEQLEIHLKDLKLDLAERAEQLERQAKKVEDEKFALQQLQGRLRELEIEEKNINERLEVYDYEIDAFQLDEKEAKIKQTEIRDKLKHSFEASEQLKREIEQLTAKKENQQTLKETIDSKLTNVKVELAKKKEQQTNYKEKIEQLIEEISFAEEKLQQIAEYLQVLDVELDDNVDGEGQIEKRLQEKEIRKRDLSERISEKRKARLDIQLKGEDIEREVKELKRQQKQLELMMKDDEVKSNRLDVELENLINHLREEYRLSFEAAKEKYHLTTDIETARKKVKLLKMDIEELGTVNLGAIDEYKRVAERYEFLTEQQNDLLAAKETIYQIIAEMDEEMKKRFESHFYSIKANFEKVFVQLFGGGKADLQLTNPDDLLETGVDIIAQPPGKKLQRLSLLSGGERALTAIALLFAILKVRPVPFCILDEVEAALDEANVSRFAQFLKEFSKETQFIVITHRKGTMEEADVLYGVTMQESGISRLVSVKLEESANYATN